MPTGCNGRILLADLEKLTLSEIERPESFCRQYPGGPALGMRLLLEMLPPGTDPFSPENVLVLAPGLLCGPPGPGLVRLTACAVSPLTEGIGKSEAGGFFAPELKAAGYDALVFRGRAPHPVYLWIDGLRAEFRDARSLWGQETGPVQTAIRKELGSEKIRVAQCGPAGENRVRYAGITNELAHFNGRNGMGAVMGAKNLRAVAVRAGRDLPVHDAEAIRRIGRWTARAMKEHPPAWGLHDLGTPGGLEGVHAAGALPTCNWNRSVFPGAADIGGPRLRDTILVQRKGCYACPIRCKRVVALDSGEHRVDPAYGGPEYETLVALGSNCGIGDLALLARASELCNRLALDTISLGMTISFAMDCYERGIIGREDTGGMDLRFGNGEILLPLIEQVGRREGFGDLLAEGSVRAARTIGKGAQDLVLATKGQEVPMHDPRVKTGLGLQYALNGGGADHWMAQHDPLYANRESLSFQSLAPLGITEPVDPLDLGPRKVEAFWKTARLTMAYDSLGMCVFVAAARSVLPLEMVGELVEAVTGWTMGMEEILEVGERTLCMQRILNGRQGLSPADDTLPARFFRDFADGPLQGTGAIDAAAFREALALFYQTAGWDPDSGLPELSRRQALGLGEFEA